MYPGTGRAPAMHATQAVRVVSSPGSPPSATVTSVMPARPPARPQHPRELRRGGRLVRERAERALAYHGVRNAVGQRKALGVTDAELDGPRRSSVPGR